MSLTQYPVIDLFAGPGGLGEGFCTEGFDVRLSIEKDEQAHRTLELRAFVRQFESIPDAYCRFLTGEISLADLYARFPEEYEQAVVESLHGELGCIERAELNLIIRNRLRGSEPWVLIGGPPCQAYSLVGRSRNKGIKGYTLDGDHRATLYREYLRVIADHWPSIFIMENVRGLLSSRLDGEPVFDRICNDLHDPASTLGLTRGRKYELHSVTGNSLVPGQPSDFIVRAEKYGIPQARHRVIIVGIREDLKKTIDPLPLADQLSLWSAINDLPRIRSGLSKQKDGFAEWKAAVLEITSPHRLDAFDPAVRAEFRWIRDRASDWATSRGGECLKVPRNDKEHTFVLNHSSRSHIRTDLHRYLFVASFGKVFGRSPSLEDFPRFLLPDHGNALAQSPIFADRFRVQLAHAPATTVTSHISKDGHYYIHPDPLQCRSLTVREAARLQTFPDNYFFMGPRTEQYRQIGNAVPPKLAALIANAVRKLLPE